MKESYVQLEFELDFGETDGNSQMLVTQEASCAVFSEFSANDDKEIEKSTKKINQYDGGLMDYRDNDDIVKITVLGVGGAGNNVVRRIVTDNASSKIHTYDSIEYVIVNTDKQALVHSGLENQVLIGESTKGQGAGSDPEKGRKAAEESVDKVADWIKDRDLVFVTAGMGGGTGTGASPVIARLAKESGALVVGVVSTPFKHEGAQKMKKAQDGIEKLKEFADALIIINNNKIIELATKRLSFSEAFALADEPLKDAILGIAGTVLEYGNEINTDFADIRTIMENKGVAHMSVGSSTLEEGAGVAATMQALDSALTNTSIDGATGVVFKVSSTEDKLSFMEYNEMSELVTSHCSPDVNLKMGKHVDDSFGDEVSVILIATGIQQEDPEAKKTSSSGLSLGLKSPRDFDSKSSDHDNKKSKLSIPKKFKQ